MRNQIRITCLKCKDNIWIFLSLLLFFGLGFSYGFVKLSAYSDFNIGIEESVSDTSFLFLISLLIAYLISGDFSNKTIWNEIKLGYSRSSVLLSRCIVLLPLAAFMHICYVIGTFLGAGIQVGIQTKLPLIREFIWLGVSTLNIMAVQSFILLIAFSIRKARKILVVGGIFTFLMCNILRNFIDEKNILIKSCFFLTPKYDTLSLLTSGISAIVTIIIVLGISCMVFHKADT